MRMETSVSAWGWGAGIRGGRLCAEAKATRCLFLRPLRTVLRGPCPRVHDTPDSVPRRPQAAPHAGPARSSAPARREIKQKGWRGGRGAGTRGDAGRRTVARFHQASFASNRSFSRPPNTLQSKFRSWVWRFLPSDFTHKSFKSKEFDNTPL